MATEVHKAAVLPPPTQAVGVIGWARRNLFATPFDAVLTILIALLLAWVVPPVVRWMFVDATWVAASREQCAPEGACWGMVGQRIHQYLFGLYPVEGQWRIVLGGVLLLVGIVPLLLK